MNNQLKKFKTKNISLWVAQVILAAGFIFGSVMKLFVPKEILNSMWPWTAEVPNLLVKITGVIDLLAVIGIIIPLTGSKQRLTSIVAIGIIIEMICAGVFHIVRGEASEIGVNIFFAIIAGFVAWGRLSR
jgi:hypothetical protein